MSSMLTFFEEPSVVILGGKEDGTIKFELPSNIDKACT
jgi:hypothetical protein